MTRSLVVRADGGPSMGVGHLARCLALVQCWVDRNGAATLVTASPPTVWADRFRAEGVEVVDPSDWASSQTVADADWVVLDGYHLGGELRAARATARRLLQIDDHGTTGLADADVLLDQNLGATPERYASRSTDTDLLLGPRYALLRREFGRRTDLVPEVPERARRLLVALGGAPSAPLRELVGAVVRDAALADLTVTPLEGVDDVAGAMADADLALSASGSTCWELCCLGVPAVLLPVAPNQEPLAAALARAGAALSAGPLTTVRPHGLASMVAGLAGDPDRRRQMARRGPQIVDGKGARRVVTRMLSRLLALRPATEADARLLWTWVNDPAVRAASFSSDPIPWEGHVEWLRRQLADPDAELYIATTEDGEPVGQVRFAGDGRRAEISVAVAPEARGRGWGAPLVEAGVHKLFASTEVMRVVARIKPENAQSRSAFEDADFSSVEDTNGGPVPHLQYARARDGELAHA